MGSCRRARANDSPRTYLLNVFLDLFPISDLNRFTIELFQPFLAQTRQNRGVGLEQDPLARLDDLQASLRDVVLVPKAQAHEVQHGDAVPFPSLPPARV